MNPVLHQALLSILRWALTFVGAWFVKQGIWTDANAAEYVTAGALALLGLGWSVWKAHRSLVERATALAMPAGSTIADLKESIATGTCAPANTPKDATPILTGTGDGGPK